jgi:hypothetical protein
MATYYLWAGLTLSAVLWANVMERHAPSLQAQNSRVLARLLLTDLIVLKSLPIPHCFHVPIYIDSSSQKQKATIDSWFKFKQHEAGRTIMYQSPNCLRKGLYIIVCTPGFFARRHTYHWFRPPGHHITQHHVTTHQFQQFPACHPCALDTYWIL